MCWVIPTGIEHSPLTETESYSAAYDSLSRDLRKYQGGWASNATHGTPPPGFFFHEEAVARVGSVTLLSLPPATTTPILPRDVAERLPFDNLQATLATFPMTSASAEIVGDTLRGCKETPAIPGEQKACATSLEATVRAAARMLGAGEEREGMGLWAAASAVPKAGLPRRVYVVTAVRRLPGDHHVGCHDMAFPYAVFHCHMMAQRTRAYVITIRAIGGGPEVDMAAMCHVDTCDWNPGHPAFLMLGSRPGGAPVCHFLPYANLLFGKTVEDADA